MADKKCPVCKKNIAEEMKFCPYCMTRFDEISELPLYKKSRKTAGAVITAGCILLVLGIGTGVYFLGNSSTDNSNSTAFENKPSAVYSDSSQPGNSISDTYSDIRGKLSGNLTAESLYNEIQNFCEQNNYTDFGINSYSSLSFNENDGKINISFVDIGGAEISIETNSEIDFATIKIIIHDTNEKEHIEQIGGCLGELFFSCDLSYVLSGRKNSCSINSYAFNMTYRTDISGEYSSEYNLSAQIVL